MTVIAELLARLGVDQRDFEKKMKRSEKLFDATAKKLMKIGRSLSVGLSAPLAAIGAIAVKTFADFDQALTQSAAIMSDTEGRMGELEEAARDVGRSTTFSATNAAEAFFFLASAGLSVDESISALPQVARFAQAGMFDLATATDLATDAMSSLGLEIDSLTRVTDVLVKANTIANASTQQFSEALTAGAGVAAKAAGIELEEVVAVLAAFADQGIKSSEAGTKFNIVIRDLTTKALRNSDAFRRFNINVFDAFKNLNPLSQIVGDLERALDGMSAGMAKATLLQLGFADKSVLSLQALIGLSDQIAEYESTLQRASGTTQEISDRQLSSFANQWKLVTAQIDDLLITLGKALVPFIEDVVVPLVETITETVKDWVDGFLELDRGTRVLITTLVAFAAAIGPLAIAAGGLLSVLGALSGLLAAGFAPILIGGAITAGIAALAIGFADSGAAATTLLKVMRGIAGETDNLQQVANETKSIFERVAEAEAEYAKLQTRLDGLIAQEKNLRSSLLGPVTALSEELKFNLSVELAIVLRQIKAISMAMMDIAEAPTLSGIAIPDTAAAGGADGFLSMFTSTFDRFDERVRSSFAQFKEAADVAVDTASRVLLDFFTVTDNRFAQFTETSNEMWDNFIVVGLSVFEQLKIATVGFFTSFSSGLGNSLAQIIVFGEDAGEVFKRFLQNLLAQTISTLVQIGVQWLLATILQSTLGVALQTQRVAQAAQLIFLNTAASIAAIPIIGPGLALEAAGALTAAALIGSKGAAAAGGAVGAGTAPLGVDTGGLITRDGAAFLHAGEVVATPEEVQSALTGEGNVSRPIDLQVMLDGRTIMRQLIRHFGSEIRIRGA